MVKKQCCVTGIQITHITVNSLDGYQSKKYNCFEKNIPEVLPPFSSAEWRWVQATGFFSKSNNSQASGLLRCRP